MKKIFFLISIFVLLLVGLYFTFFKKDAGSIKQSSRVVEQQIPTQAPKTPYPINLSIPSIGVNADIEYVGLDDKGNMDVPKDWENVAWYNLGPKPGERGSAVVAGHLDDPKGDPSVFWDLGKLNEGDQIQITDDDGKVLTFAVTNTKVYDFDKFPLQEVFADTSGKKLNLITCGGTFDKVSKNYSKRTVVYAKMVE